uniref:Uncharacterized protein n=1 Tax=Arundo donax TaxID=35708 RepID=A0A0A9AF20_ARUDO
MWYARALSPLSPPSPFPDPHPSVPVKSGSFTPIQRRPNASASLICWNGTPRRDSSSRAGYW